MDPSRDIPTGALLPAPKCGCVVRALSGPGERTIFFTKPSKGLLLEPAGTRFSQTNAAGIATGALYDGEAYSVQAVWFRHNPARPGSALIDSGQTPVIAARGQIIALVLD